MNQMTGRGELKSADPSSRRKSQREKPTGPRSRGSGLMHPQDTQGKGWVAIYL